MYREHSVGLVVPAYNEAGHVGDVLAAVPAFVDRIYAVDDRSTDDTWEEIRGVAAGDEGPEGTQSDGDGAGVDTPVNGLTGDGPWAPLLAARTDEIHAGERIVPIRHAENRGAGGAVKTGYVAALADGVDVVGTVDGDGQMDPRLLGRFLDPIVDGDADYAKGNRFAAAASLAEMPLVRLAGNALLTGLTRVASGYWSVSDPQNGYTAIRTDTLEEIGLADLFEYYAYCNEVLVRLNVAGATVRDVPLSATYGDEESHISLDTYVPTVSAMLLRNFLWRLAVSYLDPSGGPTGKQVDRYRPRAPWPSGGRRSRPTADRSGADSRHARDPSGYSADDVVAGTRRTSAGLVDGWVER